MNTATSTNVLRSICILPALMLVLTSGCSDSADSREVERASTCALGDVLLSDTPPAPEAVSGDTIDTPGLRALAADADVLVS